ncbi:MAG: hypothetical protein SFT81_00735 [Candidatus Caenarcaniphilales bacterium]|nr:hypothetical protein [Candidatus Caenarcaniphilales bacterium]
MDFKGLFSRGAPSKEDDEYFEDQEEQEEEFDNDQKSESDEDLDEIQELNRSFEEFLKPSHKDIESLKNLAKQEALASRKTKADDLFAAPTSLKEVGVSAKALQDLLLKFLFYHGELSGKELALRLHLPLYGIVDILLSALSDEHFIEVTGSTGIGGHNKIFRLSNKGTERSRDAIKFSSYVGPAPVPLNDYIRAVNEHYGETIITEEELRESYKDLVLDKEIFDQIGPAIYSGKSIFIYGPPGTGKTSIAERIIRGLKDTIKVPYAINIQGIPVRFFDYYQHIPADPNIRPGELIQQDTEHDYRWVEIKRPCIIVGTEFTLKSCEFQYDDNESSCEFPPTIKANGGLFMVDDFGRQRESPENILNRWIIPLEKQKDILAMRTGQQVVVPFKALVAFSTNLDPAKLIDAALLRRIAYKIKVDLPNLETYCQIFACQAEKMKIEWSDDILDYFIQTYYFKANRKMLASDPRDILERVIDMHRYKGLNPPYRLTREVIDRACKIFFMGISS